MLLQPEAVITVRVNVPGGVQPVRLCGREVTPTAKAVICFYGSGGPNGPSPENLRLWLVTAALQLAFGLRKQSSLAFPTIYLLTLAIHVQPGLRTTVSEQLLRRQQYGRLVIFSYLCAAYVPWTNGNLSGTETKGYYDIINALRSEKGLMPITVKQLTDAATFSLLFSIVEFYTAFCSLRDDVILDALNGDSTPTLHDLAWDLNQCYVYSILFSLLISLMYTGMRLLNRDYRWFYLLAFTYAALQSVFYPLFLVYFAFVNCKMDSTAFSGIGPLGAVATTIWILAWKLIFFWWLDRRFNHKFRPASRRPNEARLINEQLLRECGIKGLIAGEALAITLLDVD